jgi:hypothetical protein
MSDRERDYHFEAAMPKINRPLAFPELGHTFAQPFNIKIEPRRRRRQGINSYNRAQTALLGLGLFAAASAALIVLRVAVFPPGWFTDETLGGPHMKKNKYPSIVPCSRSLQFHIGRDSRGNWVVQDDQGVCGGLFIDRTQALRFAMLENGNGPQAVVMVPGVLELDMNLQAPTPREPDNANHLPRKVA